MSNSDTATAPATPVLTLLVEEVDHKREDVAFVFASADGTEYLVDLFQGNLYVDQSTSDLEAQFSSVTGQLKIPAGQPSADADLVFFDPDCEAQYNVRPAEELAEIRRVLDRRFTGDADGVWSRR